MLSSAYRRFPGPWVVFLLLFVAPAAFSQTPHTLSYQGILADTAGIPKPDGSYSFAFRLYAVSSGGSPIWSETKTAQVKHGLFSTILGSLTPIPDSVRFDRQYWLGIQVASDPELSPRMQITSVGSSINAIHADTAQNVPDNSVTSGKIAGGQVVKSINNVHDDLTLRGANGASVTASGDTLTITASGGGGGGIGTVQNTDNALTITNPGGPTTTINLHSPFNVNSNVGIGTTTPNHRLRISGGPTWTSNGWHGELEFDNASAMGWHANAAGNRYGIGQSIGGLYFFATTSDPGTAGSPANYLMTIADNANVGIGTITPTSKLEIAAQDGLAITGYEPYFTLRDANAGNARGVMQNVNGGLNLFANSYLVGTNPTAFIRLDNNGNVGIGVANPTVAKLHVDGGSGTGVYGQSAGSYGLLGFSTLGTGVGGHGTSSYGVAAYSENNDGLVAQTNHPDHAAIFAQNVYVTDAPYVFLGTAVDGVEATSRNSASSAAIYALTAGGGSGGRAIYAVATNPLSDWAGYFVGDVSVSRNLYVDGDKNFKIDHPTDPANKTLKHACVESDERLLMYSGTVVTNAGGDATIDLPSYFEALNINYRYQLTVVGEEFAQARVSREIMNNQFAIKTDKPNIKVCWQVTGDRNDAYAKGHPYVVEEEKKPEDRGKYLAPELFGQPEEKAIGYRQPPAHRQRAPEPPLIPAQKEKQ